MESVLLPIAGTVILLLLGIIAFFLKGFNNSVSNLKETSVLLEKTSVELKTSIKYMQDNCIARHMNIDKRLDAHSQRIEKNARDIASIESQIHK
jgi:hypothetical protein